MSVIDKKYKAAFLLVSLLFLLWGLANNLTGTLLPAFKRIMSMSDTQTTFIQLAFSGAYFCFAIPAAIFIRKFTYKSGVLLGLIMYALGCLLFFPASHLGSYGFYLFAIYIVAGGCAILETTANPYILSMGPVETGTRRLNMAQAFNPVGCITGILLSQYFILGKLSPMEADQRAALPAEELSALRATELWAVSETYVILGFVLLAVLILMLISKMPVVGDSDHRIDFIPTFRRLFKNKRFVRGVLAQFFYVGAQAGTWALSIRLIMDALEILEKPAASIYLISIVLFSLSRLVSVGLMRKISPERLLAISAIISAICALAVVLTVGWTRVVFLICISIFMSLMFPTIYGLSLEDVGEDRKLGASGQVLAVVGGGLITMLQGWVSDMTSISISFAVPCFCFIMVYLYARFIIGLSK